MPDPTIESLRADLRKLGVTLPESVEEYVADPRYIEVEHVLVGDAEKITAAFGRDQRAIRDLLLLLRRDERMLDAIDMRDLAPLSTCSIDPDEHWPMAHYCSEERHRHPTVPEFLADLAERAKEGE